MSTTKEIYWVCHQPSAVVLQKVHLLQKYHITVRILHDFSALIRNYADTRLNTIVIGDEQAEEALEQTMMRLTNHPEYSGVRFILSLSSANQALCQRAVDLGFRDIIPIDLVDAVWLRRYAFASSGRATELAPPHPQMSMQSIASVQVPGRLAWITSDKLWLETRLTPPVGTEMALSGGLADLLSVKTVRLKVLNRYRSHLHFRYSEALLCHWEVSTVHQSRKYLVEDFMRSQGSLAHYRFYAIIRSREIRNTLVKKLPQDRFQLTVALNKNNMIQEPRYISPDAIIIEDKMCLGVYQANFDEMLKNLDTQIPVFVIGESAKQVASVTHRIIPVATIPSDYPQYFEQALGSPKAVNLDATQIPKGHALSFGNLNLPARILSLHPDSVEIACALPLGRFGLFGLDAPIFQQAVQQKVHGKVIDTWNGEHETAIKDFPFHARAIIVDLPRPERDKVATHLVQIYSDQLKPTAADAAPIREPLRELIREPAPERIREMQTESPSPPPHAAAATAGAGPMRTEVARSLRETTEMSALSEPTTPVTSMDSEMRPLADQIVIDKDYQESRVANLFESIWEWILDIPKEWKIFAAVMVGIGLALILATQLRSPLEKQGTIFTDQLKSYKEMHDGKHRQEPSPDDTEATHVE